MTPIKPITEVQMRERIRNKYPKHFEHAYKLLCVAQSYLGDFKGTAETPFKKTIFLMGGKAFKTYYSIFNLCEIAYTEDAGVLLRSMFNLLVIMRWIREDDSHKRALKYLAWFWMALHQELELKRDSIDKDIAKRVEKQYRAHKVLFEYLDKDGKTQLRKKWHQPEVRSIKEMAESVGLSSHYKDLYRPLSSVEHSDALSYFPMIVDMDISGGKRSYALDSDLFVPAYLRNAFQYFAEIFNYWNKTFLVMNQTELKELINDGMRFFGEEQTKGRRPPHI